MNEELKKARRAFEIESCIKAGGGGGGGV